MSNANFKNEASQDQVDAEVLAHRTEMEKLQQRFIAIQPMSAWRRKSKATEMVHQQVLLHLAEKASEICPGAPLETYQSLAVSCLAVFHFELEFPETIDNSDESYNVVFAALRDALDNDIEVMVASIAGKPMMRFDDANLAVYEAYTSLPAHVNSWLDTMDFAFVKLGFEDGALFTRAEINSITDRVNQMEFNLLDEDTIMAAQEQQLYYLRSLFDALNFVYGENYPDNGFDPETSQLEITMYGFTYTESGVCHRTLDPELHREPFLEGAGSHDEGLRQVEEERVKRVAQYGEPVFTTVAGRRAGEDGQVLLVPSWNKWLEVVKTLPRLPMFAITKVIPASA